LFKDEQCRVITRPYACFFPHLFFISRMVVPGSSCGNIGPGGYDPDEAEGNEEGVTTMQRPGANMGGLLKKNTG
jgi:hypothetical protein